MEIAAAHFVRFHKSQHELDVTYHTDPSPVTTYCRLAELIEAKAEKDGDDFAYYVLGVPGTAL